MGTGKSSRTRDVKVCAVFCNSRLFKQSGDGDDFDIRHDI